MNEKQQSELTYTIEEISTKTKANFDLVGKAVDCKVNRSIFWGILNELVDLSKKLETLCSNLIEGEYDKAPDYLTAMPLLKDCRVKVKEAIEYCTDSMDSLPQ